MLGSFAAPCTLQEFFYLPNFITQLQILSYFVYYARIIGPTYFCKTLISDSYFKIEDKTKGEMLHLFSNTSAYTTEDYELTLPTEQQ
jgi:hypothetical protein